MKIKILVGLTLAVGSFQTLAANAAIDFSGAVQKDNAPAVAFDLIIPAGTTSTLTLEDGTAVEFSAATVQGEPSQSVVKLLDSSGAQLHSTTRPGNTQESKSFFYLICDGKVSYISPAPETRPSCSPSEG